MKKLLIILLGCSYAVYGQTAKPFKPQQNDDWMLTATPEQRANSLKAAQLRYEQAQRRVNLLGAMNGINQDLTDDSMARVRAVQYKQWSKVPKTPKKNPIKKSH